MSENYDSWKGETQEGRERKERVACWEGREKDAGKVKEIEREGRES